LTSQSRSVMANLCGLWHTSVPERKLRCAAKFFWKYQKCSFSTRYHKT